MDREPVVPLVGDLILSEFMADPTLVSDANGEWFEVRALANVDLNGLELANAAFMDGMPGTDQTLTSNDCLAVTAGQTVLFAHQTDAVINGGLPPVDFTFSFGLTNNSVNGVFLHIGHGGALLDEIHWSTTMPGASTSLDPDFYDPALDDIADNSDIAWCYAGSGTPDADNGQCP